MRWDATALSLFLPFLLATALYPTFANIVERVLTADGKHDKTLNPPTPSVLRSNGTHQFQPTVLMISLDGFHAQYLERGYSPNILKFGQQGLRADYMTPVFPSATFPNHYAIATGLYAESNGIVGNSFFDPILNDTFYYKDRVISANAKWWGGEPIWATAEKQGHRSGVNMWPGSTAPIKGILPTHVKEYKSGITPASKFQQVLEWIDLPFEKRPSLLLTYIPEIDSAGHQYGPDSAQVNNNIRTVDSALGYLFDELSRRNLTNIVDVLVLSDHGMTWSNPSKYYITVESIIGQAETDAKIHSIQGAPIGSISVKEPKHQNVPDIYNKLKASQTLKNANIAVYLRDEVPERLHFSKNERIGDIVVIPPKPYVFMQGNPADPRLEDKNLGKDILVGLHGYDNLDPSMRAIFVANGPSFRQKAVKPQLSENVKRYLEAQSGNIGAHDKYWNPGRGYTKVPNKRGGQATPSNSGVDGDDDLSHSRHPHFRNVEVYGLICKILGLNPAPNNGTSFFHSWWLAQ
ncbi:hypothetical protein H4219_003387 [Mycoemilia scoparia]|uniref:Uncharacterized protein n=1 Tax=Mycoemilia scoparia TaxID=417184 RepID=A0A9W8DSQ9_9FUNG|nr:hypothetical protein H4219_003387 [Mycoemilia scoparia]